MRTSVIVIRKHGEKTWSMVAGPDVAIRDQQAEMRELKAYCGEHREIAEAHYIEADENNSMFLKFRSPVEAKTLRKKISDNHDVWLAKEVTKRAPVNTLKQAADDLAAKNIAQHKKVTEESAARRKSAAKPGEDPLRPGQQAMQMPPPTPETAEPGQPPLNDPPAQDL